MAKGVVTKVDNKTYIRCGFEYLLVPFEDVDLADLNVRKLSAKSCRKIKNTKKRGL